MAKNDVVRPKPQDAFFSGLDVPDRFKKSIGVVQVAMENSASCIVNYIM